MSEDLMAHCEQKREYQVGDKREWRWKNVPVSEAVGAAPKDVRCAYCHGAVRIHQQQVGHGPQDHVEHRSRQDSEGCKGGVYFKGEHRMSSQPIS